MEDTANVIVRSLVSLWLVCVGMTGQALSFLTFEALPPQLSLVAGLPGTIFILPALAALFFGIVGIPTSWPSLVLNTYDVYKDQGPVAIVVGIFGTLFKVLFFLPFECPPFLDFLPPALQWFLFREPELIYPPSKEQLESAAVKDEYWIYVNGVATTRDAALANAQALHEAFGRPIWLCHNPTSSFSFDLIECIAGKVRVFDCFWKPKIRLLLAEEVEAALQAAEETGKYKRVVIVAHSQGAIVASHAINSIAASSDAMGRERDEQLKNKEMMKEYLEVYAFSNCAHQLDGSDVNVLENLSNKRDTLAWLGALFPFKDFWEDKYGEGIQIGGSFITESAAWGHCFKTHYLDAITRQQRERRAFRGSRLHRFLHGRAPPDSVVAYTASQRL